VDSPDQGRRRWRLVRAGTDAIPESLRRLMSSRVQPRLGTVRWTRVGAVAAGLILLAWLIFFSPVLGVRHIEVSGALVLTDNDVRQAAGIRAGFPLARLDPDEVAARVAALAPVAAVEVSRGLPSTLHIRLTERTPVAAVKKDDLYHLFDRDAVVFQTSSSLPADVVEVKLPETGPFDRPMKAAARVIESLTPRLREELVRLEISGPAGILLVLKKDRMVTWGDAEQSDQKAKVATALLIQKGQHLDVSVPEIVTIR
jgi:cell division protein FtsQ